MKRLIAVITGIACALTFVLSQAPPQAFSFKASVRGSDGQPVINRTVLLRISILQDNPDGLAVYAETFSTITNDLGQIDVEIGRGTPETGIFSMIEWAAGEYFLKIEADTDLEKKCDYRVISVTQLLSVPYALYAGIAANGFSGDYNDLINAPAIPVNISQLFNDTGYLSSFTETDGSTTNELQTLRISHDTIFLSDGGFVKLPGGMTTEGKFLYLDKDRDRYGDPYAPLWVPSGVNPPAHYTIDTLDCNDRDPFVHPDATEILDDGIDQDCDGADLSVNANWQPGDPWVDPQDGYAYGTVQIGDQVWMDENLRAEKYNDGIPIPYIQNNDWSNDIQGAYCSYIAPQIFGHLYNWYAVNTNKLCPAGWHVPSDTEWQTLVNNVGGYAEAGRSLKETGNEHWNIPNVANNRSGFTALGAGWRNINGSFAGFMDMAFFWTATQYDAGLAKENQLRNNTSGAEDERVAKYYGLSIRCLKD